MLSFQTSFAQSNRVTSIVQTLGLVGFVLSVGTGCADIANLQEHKPYPGFPDSLSVPCSDGSMFVSCDTVGDSAPQDNHTLIGRPSYRLSGSDVIDDITGLSWYATPGTGRAQAEAQKYCEKLDGNYRLPSRIELTSLLDFRANSPVLIDRTYFPQVEPIMYWTETISHAANDAFWIVNFCPNCQQEFPMHNTYDTNPNVGVLCVRDNGEPYKNGPFETAGPENLFLRDARTGLVWTKAPTRVVAPWKDGLAVCRDAQDGSFTDFRTPNIKELATIVDDTVSGMNPAIVKGIELSYYNTVWSSTPSALEGQIFTLNAYGGSIQRRLGSETNFWMLCVRGPD